MTDRLNKIFNSLAECEVFADVGCDHGYIAKAMLFSGKCKKVIVSDISAKCLNKAEELLNDFIQKGVAEAVVSDGFDNIRYCDQALIAGMGGEEITAILKKAKTLPDRLVLQPMKNCDKVRICALEKGYKIVKDSVFKSANKFYDLIILERGTDSLTQEEIEFGRDNVSDRPEAFRQMIADKIQKVQAVLLNDRLKDSDRANLLAEIDRMKKYV